jgi:GR25 family glycosyltransferase involved in LPS biosynthesis
MQTYILTMENSLRHQDLVSELNKRGISATCVNAPEITSVEFRQYRFNFNERATYAKLGYNLSDNAISCLLGHRKIYSNFLESRSEWALVLEDDVSIMFESKGFINQIPNIVTDQGPSIVQLFTRGMRFVDESSRRDFANFSVFRFKNLPGQTAAYLINRRAAQLALMDQSQTGPADWPNWADRVDFFCIYPFSFFETGEQSRIKNSTLAAYQYWKRIVSIALGLHWLKNYMHFSTWSQYKLFVVLPIWLRIVWKLKKEPTFPRKKKDGLWLL